MSGLLGAVLEFLLDEDADRRAEPDEPEFL